LLMKSIMTTAESTGKHMSYMQGVHTKSKQLLFSIALSNWNWTL